MGINFFENYYGIFDMDNQRVGFAESIYSELSPEQSTEHNSQILLNMSSREELEYYFESSGLDHGVEVTISILVLISATIGLVIAKCVQERTSEVDQEQKQARKALAQVLNDQENKQHDLSDYAQEDEMFDVPLNDDQA